MLCNIITLKLFINWAYHFKSVLLCDWESPSVLRVCSEMSNVWSYNLKQCGWEAPPWINNGIAMAHANLHFPRKHLEDSFIIDASTISQWPRNQLTGKINSKRFAFSLSSSLHYLHCSRFTNSFEGKWRK